MSPQKPSPLRDIHIVTIGIARDRDETWRECVARLVEEAGEGAVEDALKVFDEQAKCTGHSWAALYACWDFLACDCGRATLYEQARAAADAVAENERATPDIIYDAAEHAMLEVMDLDTA